MTKKPCLHCQCHHPPPPPPPCTNCGVNVEALGKVHWGWSVFAFALLGVLIAVAVLFAKGSLRVEPMPGQVPNTEKISNQRSSSG